MNFVYFLAGVICGIAATLVVAGYALSTTVVG